MNKRSFRKVVAPLVGSSVAVLVLGTVALLLFPIAWSSVGQGNVPDLDALRRAILDLQADYGAGYPQGEAYLRRLEALSAEMGDLNAVKTLAEAGDTTALDKIRRLRAFQREVLLDNPALDFSQIVAVKRHESKLGLPQNWQGNSSLPREGFDNEVILISLQKDREPDAPVCKTLFRPGQDVFVGDLCLHWDAGRLLFSSLNDKKHWHVFEMNTDGTNVQQVTSDEHSDVDFYDACYLPDSRIMLCSTACYTGVPCVYGSDHVANLFLLDRGTGALRQLCFDQDHNWSPRVLPNGRVLYQRWEYSDTPHSNTRMLFHMNPDGTDQREYWGSGVYFPNSFFFARPLPGAKNSVIGVASGHHGTPRSGRLLIVSPGTGRGEGDGILQEVPGWNKPVQPIIRDRLVDGVYPQFLHPFPITDKYFLVSAKMDERSPWGIYLVDVFDNMTLIAEQAGYALLEPIPLKKQTPPPVVADRVNLQSDEAVVFMQDVYEGGGLAGVPRGTVKSLRIFEYYFAHRGQGGLHGTLGNDSGWDIKRVLGTVPVLPDGSAYFRAPANTPLSVQPLDEQGQALQIMRSWFTLQPGEQASCVGCHESQRTAPPSARAGAFRGMPSAIQASWHAPRRGFSFSREVQPVLDRYCAGCHGDTPPEGYSITPGREFPYLRGDRMITDWSTKISGGVGQDKGGVFSESYAALQRFVRRPGIESDLHMLSPMDFHFSTTELGQLLRNGHYNVQMDSESMERIVTWVDLNAPYHGTWTETHPCQHNYAPEIAARALELRREFVPAGPFAEMEILPELPAYDRSFVLPVASSQNATSSPALPGWPFSAEQAIQRRTEALGASSPSEITVSLGAGVTMTLVYVPGGSFLMGSDASPTGAAAKSIVSVSPFWLGKMEVTNEQYRCFAPDHESRDESRNGYQFGRRGFFQDGPRHPVVRISWEDAMAFCQWMSTLTGMKVTLPTEGQWEWAARAGSDKEFFFGDGGSDFSKYANLADIRLKDFAQCTAAEYYEASQIINDPSRHDDRIPRSNTYDDGSILAADCGNYLPNAWQLHDMHGNVWEWTRSACMAYPYIENDARNRTDDPDTDRVVRGGSWRDRPSRATADFRLPYRPFQKVFNVGFRVAVELESPVSETVVAVEPDQHGKGGQGPAS